MKVFLGGTNGSKWRDRLIPMLDIDYFNPVVDDWNEDAVFVEAREKFLCDIHLYVITPKMTGCYSIAELVESAFNTSKITICCILTEDEGLTFSKSQEKSLEFSVDIAIDKGAEYFGELSMLVDRLNEEV